MKSFWASIFFFSVLFFSQQFQLAHADSIREGVDSLLDYKYRPTPEQMLNEFGGQLPAENPFMTKTIKIGRGMEDDGENKTQSLEGIKEFITAHAKDLAVIIAQLEKAFPNGVYFLMGRDAAFLGDALQAYFLGLGQADRVKWLHASGRTVKGLRSGKTGPEFLISNGFGLEPKRPHVLIDRTSFYEDSQSRTLYNIGKKVLKEARGWPYYYPIQIAVASSSGWAITTNAFKNFLNQLLKAKHKPAKIKSRDFFDVGGYWHESMGYKLTQLESGELAGVPDGAYSKKAKRIVLAYIYELFSVVHTPEFIELVSKEFKKLSVKPSIGLQNFKWVQRCDEVLEPLGEEAGIDLYEQGSKTLLL